MMAVSFEQWFMRQCRSTGAAAMPDATRGRVQRAQGPAADILTKSFAVTPAQSNGGGAVKALMGT